MARPKKENADYFPHDTGMRNDPRVKAVRAKFGLEGYAIWVCMLEVLTNAQSFQVVWNEEEAEIYAGDLGVSETETLISAVEYLIKLKLLQLDGDILFCSQLNKRLQPLVDKRGKMQERYASSTPSEPKQSKPQQGGVFLTELAADNGLLNYIADLRKETTQEAEKWVGLFADFLRNVRKDENHKDYEDAKHHLLAWLGKQKQQKSYEKSIPKTASNLGAAVTTASSIDFAGFRRQ